MKRQRMAVKRTCGPIDAPHQPYARLTKATVHRGASVAGLLEKCEGPQRTATNVYEKPRILVRSKAACPQRRTALGLPNILASRKGADMQTMYQKMDDAELASALADLKAQVAEVKARGLKLDMARGKPSPDSFIHCFFAGFF